jgi:hypothetical protein
MTTFVLIPGAGGAAWYWHRVVPLIERAGHEAIAVDLPAEDESAGRLCAWLRVPMTGSFLPVSSRRWRAIAWASRPTYCQVVT